MGEPRAHGPEPAASWWILSDAAAARALGILFIGIDHAGAGRLTSEAVPVVLRDFSDADAFLRVAVGASG
jgi:hypothetical protein